MKKMVLLSVASIVAIALSSCNKNSDTSPSPTANQPQMSYELKTTNNTNSLARTTGGASITWTSGFAYPRRITFEANKDSLHVSLVSTDTARIDLMSSVSSTFGGFMLPSGTYREVEIRINLERNGSYPSLQLDGNFTDSTTTIPIELQINEPLTLQTEQHDVTITDTSSFVAVTTLDLSSLTSGVTSSMLLSAATTGGTVVISPTYNRAIYMIIMHNFLGMHYHFEFEHHHGHDHGH